MKISYSFGMMDLFHYGHAKSLMDAKKGADIHIFGLVSDEGSDAWFGSHVSDERERKKVVESIKYIDEIMIQKTFDPLENLKIIHAKYPDAIITLYHGNEWGILSAKQYVESIGGKVIKLEYYEKLSPANILKTLNNGSTNPSIKSNALISTKANTLFALKDLLSKSKIEEMVVITVGEYNENPNAVMEHIQQTLGCDRKIVVRSSSKREDAYEESNAGHFESVLNVDTNNKEEIIKAIDTVIKSYDNTTIDEQVLIQHQTEDVLYSGVVFTRDILKNRPYYVINYDDRGDTSAVTSGNSRTKSIWVPYSFDWNAIPNEWKRLMISIKELEELLSGTLLDIEFAITNKDVVIFQVRPLAAAYKFGRNNNDEDINKAQEKAIRKYRILSNNNQTCFSDMAFWNPSEIIGDNPHQLDYSLYREIVTKHVYNDALLEMGYSKTNDELMYRFMNKPYINLENSFITLTPNAISEETKRKLLNFYLLKFANDITCHDKIEFEIVYNCFDFTTRDRVKELSSYGFNEIEISEILEKLKSLTINNISNYNVMLQKDLKSLEQLEIIREKILKDNNSTENYINISKSIRTLIEAIKQLGTPQFSRHARSAFIAKSLLKSLLDNGDITPDNYHDFLSNINTIAVDYSESYRNVINGTLDKETFLSRFGHLRAGTYNIRSPRYDEINNLFEKTVDNMSTNVKKDVAESEFAISLAFKKELENENIKGIYEKTIIDYIRTSTEQREYFKYVFTKSLSLCLSLIKKMGDILNINVKDLSYLELPEVYAAEYYSKPYRLKEFWDLIIKARKENYRVNSLPVLPSVITSINDFSFVEIKEVRANYITNSVVEGELVVLSDDNSDIGLDNKIVVVEKADPGYDYIFTHNIKGLVTKYGGAASHMAIRCAEFNIPAAIGCGKLLFDYVLKCKAIVLDAKHEKIIKVK